MTEKTESAAASATEEGLAATCEGIARDYLAHRGYGVHAGDGWSCDCEDAPIVAADGDETVLIAVISAYEEGSARMPELNVGAAELAIMRRATVRGNPGGRPFPAATAAAKPSRGRPPRRQEHLTTAGRESG